jgi:nucleotide-binding universal stress UspA family protein
LRTHLQCTVCVPPIAARLRNQLWQIAAEREATIMSIKRILVPIPGSFEQSANPTVEIETAISAAKALGAHMEALFIMPRPVINRRQTSINELGYRTSTAAAVAPVNWYAEERDRMLREVHETFERICAAGSIPILSEKDEPGTPLTAAWGEAEGEYATIATQRAAAFDLIIAASSTILEQLKEIAELSLLQTRRPVLLAPVRLTSKFTDGAMIAWDASPECWHAVSAAIPFLQMAKKVEIVSVDRNANSRQASQTEVLAYLRSHGIAATAQVVAPDLRSVGDTLLAEAGDHESGLLVMGAYSHSRLREMLLGGATRHVLKHATARPVLLAH